MKKIFTLLALLCVAFSSQAQNPTFKKGDEITSLGLGVGGSYGLPISLHYEMGIMDINDKSSIGVGGTMAYQHKNLNQNDFYDSYAFNGFTIAVSGAYHYYLVKNLDLSASLSLGYTMGQVTAKYNEVTGKEGDNFFYFGFNVGARYYFTEDLAAFARLGYSPTSIFEIGVAYRFSFKQLIFGK